MESFAEKFKITTLHNRIELRRRGNRVELASPGGALQSVIDLDHPQQLQLDNLEHLMAIQLFVPPPRRILLLGVAGGSLIHYLRHYRPRAEIVAVDIDVELVERMLSLQLLPPADDRLTYVYDDARHFIAHDRAVYDLLLVDIFSGAQSPGWLSERDTLEQLFRRVGDDGGVGFNLLIASETDFRRYYRNLRQVFDGRTLCLPVAGYENSIAFGFRAAPPPRNIGQWIEHAATLEDELGLGLQRILSVIYNTNPIGGGLL